MGSDAQWAPYIIINEDGSLSGYDKDILNLINKKTGANFQLVVGKWKDVLQKAKTKEIDGLSTSAKHAKRDKFFNFSKPYISTKRLLIVSSNNPKQIHSSKDLSGKKIGYQEKNLFDKKLMSIYKDSTLVPMHSVEDIVNKLVINEIDVIAGGQSFLYMANKLKLRYLKIVEYLPNSTLNLVFSVRKDYPEAISILNKGLESISEFEKIRLNDKWFFNRKYLLSKESKKNKDYKIQFTNQEKKYLKSHPILTVQNLSDFPPFNFNENGIAQGYSVEYMRLMGKYMGVDIKFISGKPWKEYLSMLKDKTLDVIPHIAVTEERKKFVTYTNFNHIEYTTGMAINRKYNIDSMYDLNDKIIAVVNKTFLHNYLKNKFPQQKLLLTNSTAEAIEAVYLGKAYAVIGSLPSIHYYIQKNWYTNIKITNIKDLGIPTKTQLPMGVGKENIILKSILEKVNRSLSRAEVGQLKEKWMHIKTVVDKKTILNKKEIEYLNSKKEIKMCVLPNWLPFEQIDEKGKHRGIGADIMKLVSEYIDTPIKLLPTKKWETSVKNIRDRKCDILPVSMNVPSRRDSMNFTKPYVSEPFVIATKLDELFIRDSKAIGSRKIGIVKNYAYKEFLKKKNPNIKIIDVKNAKEGLELVRDGELFAYVDILPAIGYMMQKYSMVDLKIAGKLEYEAELSVASRNDEPLLNSIMQKALDEISKEHIKRIVGRWISIKVQQSFDYTKLFYVIAFFSIIIFFIVYKNRTISQMNSKLALANEEIREKQEMVNKYVLIMTTDLKGVITDVNEAYCKTIKYTNDELIGESHKIMRHPDMSIKVFEKMWKTIKENKTWVGEIINYTKQKDTKYFNAYIEPLFKNNHKIGYRAILEDVTDKKRIEELSITDKLTGIYNRAKLEEVLIYEYNKANRFSYTFGLILIDIDYFKVVNDTYGHQMGDKVLQEIANILKKYSRKTDTVGRWGGEEFLIICSKSKLEGMMVLAEKLRESIASYSFAINEQKTASFGISMYKDKEEMKELISRADQALYAAKSNGRNTVEYLI